MSIEAYEIPTLPVLAKGEPIFHVRGLDVEDLTFLAQNYLEDIRNAIVMYGVNKQRVAARQNLNELVLLAAKDFPPLVAEIISRAAGEPGQTDKVRRMPFMIQIMALKNVLTLTTEEAGGLKNLIAVLAAALEIDQTKLPGVTELTTRLQAIIGESGTASASSSDTDTSSPPVTP
jgi:hypothetical protein